MTTLIQYADDTQFLHSSSIHEVDSLIQMTELTLRKARAYFTVNGLLLKDSKTMYFYRK